MKILFVKNVRKNVKNAKTKISVIHVKKKENLFMENVNANRNILKMSKNCVKIVKNIA
jgi:hypothetical protein